MAKRKSGQRRIPIIQENIPGTITIPVLPRRLRQETGIIPHNYQLLKATNFPAGDLTSVFEETPPISVRKDSLLAALSNVNEIVGHIKDSLKSNKLSLDKITIELGVSAGGHVGFLGTGVETEASAKFSLEIKVGSET